MGNCIETCIHQRQEVEENGRNERAVVEKAGGAGDGELLKENMSKETNSSMKIKIVLKKEELEWLLFQLKNKEGQRLEDVLDEIERGRRRMLGWKPSLESITESPEVPEQMNR